MTANSMLKTLVICQFICTIFCQNISYPTVRKCVCEFNQAQTEVGGCVEFSNQAFRFWDEAGEGTEHVVMASQLEDSVIIAPILTCPENMIKMDDFAHSFFINLDGYLIDSVTTNLYCIENVILNDAIYGQRIEKCVENIEVPMCCPLDQVLGTDGACNPSGLDLNIEPLPPVVTWLKKFINVIRDVKCKSDIRQIYLPIISLPELKLALADFESRTNNSFCLAIQTENKYFSSNIIFCSDDLAPIPLCCADEMIFDYKNNSCVYSNETFNLPASVKYPPKGAIEMPAHLNCSTGYSILELEENKTYLISSIGGFQPEDNDTQEIPFEKYCLGGVLMDGEISHTGLQCIVHDIQYNLRFVVQRICLSISCVFIIATLTVYLSVSDLRKRIGGFCLISELVALLISHITLIILLNPDPMQLPHAAACLTIGIIVLVSTLSSFFWLNVMCYDVWSTFRKLRPFSEKISQLKVMIKYSLYAWGLPILVGIIAIVTEKTDSSLRPNFTPHDTCFFSVHDISAQWIYLYGIILVLLLINLGFFIHLAIIMKPCQPDRRKLFQRPESVSSKNSNMPNSENIKLYAKLFVIMGLPWLLDVSTSLVSDEAMNFIWFLDVLNMLRGILIFLIFVCKESTRKLIVAAWFPSLKTAQRASTLATDRSRKTSMMSMSSWIPSIKTRRTSKVSLNSDKVSNLNKIKEVDSHPDN